jgi:eukaryotic-like serine/threonine-protein kinase
MIGTTLQHYRIVRALGSGGMGDVYVAEDTRLHRLVALKLLPVEMAVDAERLERFQREAQAVAALNHPNVVTLYGVEHADGHHFLAMELIEGKTLAETMKPHGFPFAEFRRLAVQLTDAISAAHDAGIIHRDLKPANVMVLPDGRVKVLDFGLAKVKPNVKAVGGETRTAAELTGQHHVIGTAAYMSPEQAEGRPADARSDIFSLGVVLYQMATGTRPFMGDTAMSVISSILKDTPAPPSNIIPAIPRELDRIIRRCLAKDPSRRYQSATDLRNDLEDVQEESGPVASRSARRRPGLRSAAVVSALLIVAAVGFWRGRRSAPALVAPVKTEFAQLTAHAGVEWFPSLSPDGKWIVYAADGEGPRHIYLQSVTGQARIDLTKDSTWDEDQPAFSPDGERIAFRSSRDGGGLFVMGRTGEAVKRVTRRGFKPAWSPDGTQLAFSTENVQLNPQNAGGRSEVWTVKIATGEMQRISDDGWMPSWSPHNQRIAYAGRMGNRSLGDLYTIPVTGGTPVAVTTDAASDWNPVWSPDGRFLYFSSDRSGSTNLERVAIDEATGTPLGEPQSITTPAASLAHPTISADGTKIAYSATQVTANLQKLSFDPVTGSVVGDPRFVTSGSRRWSSPDPSPDGQWVAFYSVNAPTRSRDGAALQEGHVYIARADGTALTQVTGDSAIDRLPRWSPDGKWLVFFSDRTGQPQLWKISRDGGELQQLTEESGAYPTVSPDGTRIATVTNMDGPGGPDGVWVFDPNRPWKTQKPEKLPPMRDPPGAFVVNSWSPDNQRLAGQLNVTGSGILTYSFATRTYERLTDFGEWPVWLPDSRRLLFVSHGKTFHVVDSQTKQVRPVFSVTRDVIGPPRLTRDGRTAYFSRRTTESDIWMVTLTEPR